MNRPYNFGAGPAMLPLEILEETQAECLDWQNTGMSILEQGHRTDLFQQLLVDAENLLRKLLNIPSSYEVLFLSGAARLQFGMIPLNFLQANEKAGYLLTGLWSLLAYQEALRLNKQVYCIASGEKNAFLSVPPEASWEIQQHSSYLYYTPNETVNGLRCKISSAAAKGIALIADMTSCILTEPCNIQDYALIFAGAQKTIANAGLTVVIKRKDYLGCLSNPIPTMLDYRVHAEHHSLYATPPTFNCYLALKMFQWIEKQGGVSALYEKNKEKAKKLYDFIDASSAYNCNIPAKDRSIINVCFNMTYPKYESAFLEKAEKAGLLALKGHRTVGGLRASLYNAMPLSGVEKLIDFMNDFARKVGV